MSSSPSRLSRPIIQESLQRFDIADHELLTKFSWDLFTELLKDVVVEGVGRVFYGFEVTFSGNTVSVADTGLAVTASGDLLARTSGDPAWSSSVGTVTGNRVFPVYAYVLESDGQTDKRRRWVNGAEQNSTPVIFKSKSVEIVVGADKPVPSAPFTVTSLFPTAVNGATVLPLALVYVSAGSITEVKDYRRMFAVGHPAPQPTPTDWGADQSLSVGTSEVTGVRSQMVSLANQITNVVGKINWYDTPSLDLEETYALFNNGQGISKIMQKTLSTYSGAFDGEVVRTSTEGLYVWDTASTATADGVMVVAVTGVSTGRWVHVARGVVGLAYGLAGLDSAGRPQQQRERVDSVLHFEPLNVQQTSFGISTPQVWVEADIFNGTLNSPGSVYEVSCSLILGFVAAGTYRCRLALVYGNSVEPIPTSDHQIQAVSSLWPAADRPPITLDDGTPTQLDERAHYFFTHRFVLPPVPAGTTYWAVQLQVYKGAGTGTAYGRCIDGSVTIKKISNPYI